MPATPAQLRDALRRLAGWPATELPVISAYLDLRPQATVGDPQVRSGLIVLRDRLRALERDHEPHTPSHASLERDAARLDDYLDDALPAAQCVCLFACSGAGDRFEAVHTARDIDDEVSAGDRPRLLPLARLADEEPAIVALADTNTLRLFGLRSGALDEIGLLDDEPDDYSRADVGGWSQARFARHVEEHREAFAQLAAEAIEEVAGQEAAQIVVLAGDEVALPLLVEALPKPLAESAHTGLRIDMRAPVDEVAGAALPFLDELRAQAAADAADRLVGAVRGRGMAVGGIEETRAALERGQVAELLLDPAAELEGDAGEGLVRLAAATDARVRFAADHGGLRQLGGAGGLLRFRLGGPVSGAQSDDRREGAAVTG